LSVILNLGKQLAAYHHQKPLLVVISILKRFKIFVAPRGFASLRIYTMIGFISGIFSNHFSLPFW